MLPSTSALFRAIGVQRGDFVHDFLRAAVRDFLAAVGVLHGDTQTVERHFFDCDTNCGQALFQLRTGAVRAAVCSFVWRVCARRTAGTLFTARLWRLPPLAVLSRARLWTRCRRRRGTSVPSLGGRR